MSNPKRQPVPAAAPATTQAESATASAAAASDKAQDAAASATGSETQAVGAPGAATVASDDGAAPVADGEQVEARVLVAFEAYDANDVAIVRAADVERLVGAGKIDPHPDAVAYAKSLIGD